MNPSLANAHKKWKNGYIVYESLEEHLRLVESYIKKISKKFNLPGTLTRVALWHDLGKNCALFQHRLAGGKSFDHSSAGAVWSLSSEVTGEDLVLHDLIAYAIAGHHVGMPNARADCDGQVTLNTIYKKPLAENPTPEEALKVTPEWRVGVGEDLLRPSIPLDANLYDFIPQGTPSSKWAAQLLGRMIFSALVDSDFLATEEFMRGKRCHPSKRSQKELFADLKDFVSRLESTSKATPMNIGRRKLREEVWGKIASRRGFKQLRVPTGGGKTLLSIGYALGHNVFHNALGRVIYAAPFTTILDEISSTLCEALKGEADIVEHHQNLVEDKDTEINRLLSENWDAPLVLTSHVQLIDSLHSNKPGKCRKLHNLIGSTIIIDEVQSLPLEMLAPICASLDLLVKHYGVTVILCSATQLPLTDSFLADHALENVEDLAPAAAKTLFGESGTSRTIEDHIGVVNLEKISRIVSQEKQILCIFNTRKICLEAYLRCSDISKDGLFHLSTWMTPKDRKTALLKIRKRLMDGQEVRVISTSLIEAGVNLDFPVLMRETTGSSSLAQGAGRCNREGKMPSPGRVMFFDMEGKSSPEIREMAVLAKVAHQETGAWIDEETIDTYFRLLVGRKAAAGQLDSQKLFSDVYYVSNDTEKPKLCIDYRKIAESKCIKDTGASICALPLPEWDDLEKKLKSQRFLTREQKKHIQQNSFSFGPRELKLWEKQGKITLDMEIGTYRLTDPANDYCPEVGAKVQEEYSSITVI
jgi:CRISPR-associated endonuclease/helicase Cas3